MEQAEQSRFLRRTDCTRYLSCLDHAVAAGWQNFTCRWCTAHESRRLDDAEIRAEAEACAELLAAAVEEWRKEDEEKRRTQQKERLKRTMEAVNG
jgi:hypothetical protein